MKKLPILKPGDRIEIIAPASRCTDKQLIELQELLSSWKLNCFTDQRIFGPDLLCANTDEVRFELLKNALLNSETKAIICARGGYGSMRLIPELATINPPAIPKLFIGMSDITALHLYLQNQWQWPVLHGALAVKKFSPESIATLKSLLFAETEQVNFIGIPLNKLAKQQHEIEATITGGNLCLVQTSIGTSWELRGQNNIIFLEEVGERGYRIDRMLEHLEQANIFKHAAAIVFGDFIQGNEPDGSSLITPVLERFAQNCHIPVLKIEGIGHDYINFPMPLGTKAKLKLGNKVQLACYR